MAAANAVWTGHIRFGLVSLPIRVYTAANSSGGAPSLNQIHKDCGQRIQQKKTCPEHGELRSDEICSGYEHTKGQYVVIDQSDLAKLRTKPDKSVEVEAFVPSGSIDQNYFSGQNYYLGPDGMAGNKPYALLHRVISERQVQGFCTAYIRGRKQLMLLRPVGNVLGLAVLNFQAEVRPSSMFDNEVGAVELAPKELQLTKTLIDSMAVDAVDLSEYADDYAENLKALIEAKLEGRQVVTPQPQLSDSPMVNLLEALERSIAESKKKKPAGAKKPPKQVAPGTAAKRAAGAAKDTRRRKSS